MIARQLLASLLIASSLVGCGRVPVAQDAPTPLPPQPDCSAAADPGALCILVLGDSIAAGVPLSGDDRWWVHLAGTLGTALPDRTVVIDSWAVPGSRVDVLESAARDQSAIDSYDIAIVIEGVNDEIVQPVDTWQARYEAVIAAMEQRGLIVIVGTPPPGFQDGAFATRYDPTANALREVAHGRPLLDIAARWHADGAAVAATYYSDLIHQSEAGQLLMAEMAHEVVLHAIEKP